MSAILKELLKATGLEDINGADQADLKKVIKAVAKLSDKEWGNLSEPAQDWYNAAADAVNDKKDVVALVDEEEKPAARRRAAPADEKETPATGGPDILKKGQTVEIENKRGKKFSGKVVELDDEVVTLDSDDEIDLDKIVSVKVLEDVKAGRAAKDEPEAGDAEPGLGDEVELTNKRGKVFTGEIIELTADEIVIKTDDGDEDFDREKVTSIKVLKKAKAAAKEEEKTTSRRAAAKDEPKDDDKPKRSSNPKGVSVGARIRELMTETLGISEEAVGKKLTKEGIEFRPPTLTMIYKDTKAVIDLLVENKHMKAAK